MSVYAIADLVKLLDERQVKFIDLRFTDSCGKDHHITVPVKENYVNLLQEGKLFDGSSIAGWRNISNSDMLLKPDLKTAVIDPFYKEATLIIRCDVCDPVTMLDYERDPRAVARRAEQYLKTTGIADVCYMGPELEFFIFDDVRWTIDMHNIGFSLDSKEGSWNSGCIYNQGNMGHRPRIKGGYFPVPPVDSAHDLRSTMCLVLQEMGIIVETHHHEVATANQNEINTRFSSLLAKADELQMLKYVIHNVAHSHDKTATFMPKPLFGDNGSGMHCHQSLAKDGKNLFAGEGYAGLSELALYYIGGIIKHAKALNAFANASTNSYKRLTPGYEAPVMLAYAARNRSAAIRIPHVEDPKARRIEVRFPDGTANPYLAFAAMLMAGLDGILNKIHPGKAMDKDLYDLAPAEAKRIPTVCGSLEEAMLNLQQDHEFLLKGNVFTKDLILGYMQLKMEEVKRLNLMPHPLEFDMYYSV